MKISVVIQTYNAERFLEKVLNSVKEFDEIVVCDMYSTDRTIEISEQYNCKIVYHEYTGIVEPARNFAISNASNDWVLVLDADEVVTPDLRNYLYDFIKDSKDINGIRISRKNYFLGRFMHATYPDYIIRFFRKEVAFWPSTIHTSVVVQGKVIDLPRKRKELALIHLVNPSLHLTIEKTNTYSDFEVIRKAGKNYGYFSLLFRPCFRFIHHYILKGGFRDGIPGLIFAMESSFYKFITIAKIIESKVKPEDMNDDLKI